MIFGNIQSSMLEKELTLMQKPLYNAICFLKDHDMAAHEPGVFQLGLSCLTEPPSQESVL
jgi:hypothetical protein